MDQLHFTFEADEETLRRYLEKAVKKKISIVFTENSSSMLSLTKKNDFISLRLHRIFLSAGSEVLNELAGFIKNSKMKTPNIRKYINLNRHCLKKRAPRKMRIKTKGRSCDLHEIFNSLNREYFDGGVSAAITWGSRGPRRAAARRTLGSFSGDNNVIRINPILDSRMVPRYFLEFIVYHEILHADMGVETGGSRRSMHSKEFKRREKVFRYYERAISWEKKIWG